MALAVYTVNWTDFDFDYYVDQGDQVLHEVNDDPLPDGDHIYLAQADGAAFGIGPTTVGIVLTTAPSVTWYKEIKGFDANGQSLDWVATQDQAHGPVSMSLPVGNTQWLVFTKAKFLGIHTGIYQVDEIDQMAGKQLTFNWTSD